MARPSEPGTLRRRHFTLHNPPDCAQVGLPLHFQGTSSGPSVLLVGCVHFVLLRQSCTSWTIVKVWSLNQTTVLLGGC